jgi:cobalamin biosynthetic protein CobC
MGAPSPSGPGGHRDHGGGLDAARGRWGGCDWIDLSTGINPVPYPLPELPTRAWTALPDRDDAAALEAAARATWRVPEGTDLVAAPGASALIARLPSLAPAGAFDIPGPTYNEHEAAFRAAGWHAAASDETPAARVLVHPNNPDGRLWSAGDADAPLTVIDESFCDVTPDASLIGLAARPGTVVLKSFGKFWGLAGLRLGFAIGRPETAAPLRASLGPWPVSGPALAIGTAALRDSAWAGAARARLARDAARLDALMAPHGPTVGGTDLFRLYDLPDAAAMQDRLARNQVWSRIFPYSGRWLRLGLPPAAGWERLQTALG